MHIRKTIILLIFLPAFFINNLKSQFSGSELLEFQYGKIPGDTSLFPTVYNKANFNYSIKRLKAGITLEQFYSKNTGSSYTKPTQVYLQYNSELIEIKAGNFYETIGRGLLLRSYEIQGALTEDLSYRSRHYFHRDIMGISTKLRLKNFNTKMIYGKPLNNVFPPSLPQKTLRTDEIAVLYSDFTARKQTAGASVLYISNQSGSSYYTMASLQGKLFPFLSYYSEVSKNLSGFKLNDFSKESEYALYSAINLTYKSLGISAEYKNYNNFTIGAGINEPPALVKEHTYKVLNRSTHALQPLNETGYQIEMFYTFPGLSTLTLNNTIAVNNFGKSFIFREYFAGYEFSVSEIVEIKVFFDYASDPFKGEMNRMSGGTYTDWSVGGSSSINATFESQSFKRNNEKVRNLVLSAGCAFRSKVITGLTVETSNDPFLTEGKKIWAGTDIKYQINNKNSMQIFVGSRRGGPACNAGICYEVLDFSGIEFRITSRF